VYDISLKSVTTNWIWRVWSRGGANFGTQCTTGTITTMTTATAGSLLVITFAKEAMFLPVLVCLSVRYQDNSKSYKRIFLKFWGHVGNGKNYQWFNFEGDLEGILDSGSLWNFHYHCFQWGIREPLANRRWCWHLANNIALAEVCGLWLLSSLVLLHCISVVS